MVGFDERLREVLDGYAACLREKELALAKHQPYLVRWVKDFLLFARERSGRGSRRGLRELLGARWQTGMSAPPLVTAAAA